MPAPEAPPVVWTEADIERLAAAFVEASLPAAAWTHTAHLVVGAWHVFHCGADALPLLRARIRRLNDAHGTPNTAARGYHETITASYLRLIAATHAADGAGLAALVAKVLGGPIGERDVLLRHHSRARLSSPEARAAWIEPDLEPLPP